MTLSDYLIAWGIAWLMGRPLHTVQGMGSLMLHFSMIDS